MLKKKIKLPKAPDYLDEIAKSQWQSKIKVLAERGDITSEDYTNLELYCVNYSLYRQAVQNIAERGFSITNSQGTEARNPALTAKSEAEKIIIKMSSLLGFDPVSRRKTPIDTDEADELDNL
ncbi:TPA: phage terminase small subunit P27 family [Pasteurella multocida]|nr:phage terminase small subunit P27 family [Pasteurella multocida]HEA3267322.1 phage terminase small subunit P27 family [Pasteurella multocida]